MPQSSLAVACVPTQDGWNCDVMVGDDPGATRHHVQVSQVTLLDLAPGRSPEELVRESFAYLLEREPRESIMRTFELPIIARFFGDYADEISRRLRGD